VDPNRNLAFVATGSQGVAVVDISRPAHPKVIHRIALPGTANHVAVSQNLLSVAHWQGFTIIDVSDPKQPKRIASHYINNERGTSRTMATAISSEHLVAGEWFGLHAFKVIPSFANPVEMEVPLAPPRPDLVGQTAPNILATFLDGTPWQSADHRGKVIVLSFFGTFCPICLNQMADIESLIWQPLKGDKLEVIALGVNETQERITRFISQAGITFPVAIAADGLEEGLLGRKGPGISQYPFDVVIAPDGTIVYQSTRYESEELLATVNSLLKSP